jgi:hypothetical protein
MRGGNPTSSYARSAKKTLPKRILELSKKPIGFGVVSDFVMIENWEQLFDYGAENMDLVEEKEWGMPWPEFEDSRVDERSYNLRIYEIKSLTLPENKALKLEYENLLKLEESKLKARRMIACRTRYVKRMIRIIFKRKTENLHREGYNNFVHIATQMVMSFGQTAVQPIEIRVAIFSISYAFAFLLRTVCL